MSDLRKVNILGVGITDTAPDKILEYIFTIVKRNTDKCFVITPNPEILVYADKHKDYKDILNSANVALPDGIGILLAGKLLRRPVFQRITGVDFMGLLCQRAVEKGASIGLLGGKPGVAEEVSDCLRKKYPGLKISFAGDDPDKLLKSLKVLNIAILFVAFGHPKQEIWIHKHLQELPVKVAMGVGGAFDYLSGRVPRAPKLLQNSGLEWLYRLIRQPWRWRRQLALAEFCVRIIKEKIAG